MDTQGGSRREYIIVNLVMCAFIIAGMLLGETTLSFMILVPACLILIAVRQSPMHLAASVLICLALPSLLAMTLYPVALVFSVPCALFMAIMFKRRQGMLSILIMGVAGFLISFLSLYLINMASADTQGQAAFSATFFDMAREAVDKAAQLEGFTSEQRDTFYNALVLVSPALYLCECMFLCYFIFLISRAVLRRLDSSYNYFRPFWMLRTDRVSAVLFLVALFVGAQAGGLIGRVLLNIAVIIAVFMLVCGFALAYFFILHLRARLLRALLCAVSIVLMPILIYLYIPVGLIDAFADIRRVFIGVRWR